MHGLIQAYSRTNRILNSIKTFGNIVCFRDLSEKTDEAIALFGDKDAKGTILLSSFSDYYKGFTDEKGEKENINDDVVFEMELIKQVDINIDYILMLVAKYHDSHCQDSQILVDIRKAIGGSLELRSKKQLIEDFIAQINTSTDIQKDRQGYIAKKREAELSAIIAEQKLKPEETKAFVENAFRDGTLRTTGTDIDRILPPVSRFGGGKAGGNRSEVKKTVVDRLRDFFEKYFGV